MIVKKISEKWEPRVKRTLKSFFVKCYEYLVMSVLRPVCSRKTHCMGRMSHVQ